ncbi:NADH dehydrogenase [Ceratobasidium sp. AG-Ba]|nr:NADH dehydrogenase [Ceratobasidium sp. AG-Ba]
MGKWSPAYHDDLLHMKFRCLTYNAVDKLRKLKVEDDLVEPNPDPRITHEQFIQAYSFTQRIIEILVQEHAVRRQNSRSNRGNPHGTIAHSARTANALLALSESCRGPHQPHPLRRADFALGMQGWDSDGAEDAVMDGYGTDPDTFPFPERPTLGSRIGSSLRESQTSGALSSTWMPVDILFSPPAHALDLPSPPPPPAPSTRPNNLLSMMPGRSTSSLTRQSLTRRPASASGVTYFRPRHRTADFESQTQRLRDRARARDLVEYAHSGPNSSSASSSGGHVPPESFARRETGPTDELESRPSSSLSLPPAPVPAHAHAHSSTIRRVTSELSSLDRTIEAHRRELSAAREDFAARFRRGVSNLAPILNRSPSPLTGSASQTQPRESLRAALWGAGPRDEDGLPTPRSLTPEFGERGATAL